jgi:ATP-dependent RNA helicase DDX46/PRP5
MCEREKRDTWKSKREEKRREESETSQWYSTPAERKRERWREVREMSERCLEKGERARASDRDR